MSFSHLSCQYPTTEHVESIKHTLKMLSAVTIAIFFSQIQRKCPVDIPQLFPDVLVMNWLCRGVCLQS